MDAEPTFGRQPVGYLCLSFVVSLWVWYWYGGTLEEPLRRLTLERKRWKRADALQTSRREHCRCGCPIVLKAHAIQSLSWCSQCDPNNASEKRAWRRRIGFCEQRLSFRLFCISSQSHRFLFYICTQDFLVALTLIVTHYFNATHAIGPSIIDSFQFLSSSLFSSRVRDCGVVWNLCLRQVILALIRIPHVYLWSGRVFGVQGYETKEENPQTCSFFFSQKNYRTILKQMFFQFNEVVLFSQACGMMTYSEILAANCEFTWMNETQSAGEGSCVYGSLTPPSRPI